MSELLGVVTAEALISTLFHLLSFLSLNTPFMPLGTRLFLICFYSQEKKVILLKLYQNIVSVINLVTQKLSSNEEMLSFFYINLYWISFKLCKVANWEGKKCFSFSLEQYISLAFDALGLVNCLQHALIWLVFSMHVCLQYTPNV